MERLTEHPSLDSHDHDGRDPLGGIRETFGAWTAEKTIAAADMTVARLRDFGISVPSNGRLPRAQAEIARAERFHVRLGTTDRAMEEALAEANRTVFELYYIVSRLQPPNRQTTKKLRVLLGGPSVPDDSRHDPARDTQAEFFSAALLRAAGYAVTWGEPDLIITRDNRSFGVAVKRVTSDEQFRRRVRKAAAQLRAANLTGLIIVNAERFLARAYARDRDVNVSTELYRKTGEWVNYIDESDLNDRILIVAGLATSFRLQRPSVGRQFDFMVHFHPHFVVEPGPEPLDTVHRVAAGMTRAVINDLKAMALEV